MKFLFVLRSAMLRFLLNTVKLKIYRICLQCAKSAGCAKAQKTTKQRSPQLTRAENFNSFDITVIGNELTHAPWQTAGNKRPRHRNRLRFNNWWDLMNFSGISGDLEIVSSFLCRAQMSLRLQLLTTMERMVRQRRLVRRMRLSEFYSEWRCCSVRINSLFLFFSPSENSLLMKILHKDLRETKSSLEIQRTDPNSPLHSVKSFDALHLWVELWILLHEEKF